MYCTRASYCSTVYYLNKIPKFVTVWVKIFGVSRAKLHTREGRTILTNFGQVRHVRSLPSYCHLVRNLPSVGYFDENNSRTWVGVIRALRPLIDGFVGKTFFSAFPGDIKLDSLKTAESLMTVFREIFIPCHSKLIDLNLKKTTAPFLLTPLKRLRFIQFVLNALIKTSNH